MHTSPQRVIIDTDPGIDDALAILFALLSERFQVDALTTTFGNCSADISAQNALRLVEMVGRGDIPVYRGAAEPLVCRRLPPTIGASVHGENGLGDVPLRLPEGQVQPGFAAAEIARRVVETPGEITILALAPLTNIALALRLEPRFAASVAQIVYMGGIVSGPGNVTSVATANILNDPEAAKVVFNANIEKFTLVGQDVTRKVRVVDDLRLGMRSFGGDIAEIHLRHHAILCRQVCRDRARHPGLPRARSPRHGLRPEARPI